MQVTKAIVILALLLAVPILVFQSTVLTVAQVQAVYTGLDFPVAFEFAPDGRLFFNEKNTGKVRVIQNGVLQSTAFAQLTIVNSGEQGLLGLELDPNFATNGYVYLYYTYSDGSNYHARITRYTASGNVGTNPVHIFDVTDPSSGSTNHNGGYIKFGPDGKLYVQVGEFATTSQSQDPNSNAGKILRMNSDGTAPSDNPSANSLVWASGIRNGFGMDFDPFTNRLVESEAGPSSNDEVNVIVKGGNYGWPNCSGICNNPSYVDPILAINPVTTPTGIAYTTTPNVLYFGEYNTGNLKRLELTSSGTVVSVQTAATVGSSYNGILAVELGNDGQIYFSTSTTIYKLTESTGGGGGATATTTLDLVASQNPTTANIPVTFTLTLRGFWNQLTGTVSGKQVTVAGWSTSGSCTTSSTGSCQVVLTTPSTPAQYQVTASFAGDANFDPSSSSLTLSVDPSGNVISAIITVNSYPGTFRLRVSNLNNIAVCIKSQDILKGETRSLVCPVTPGTYRIEVFRYTSRIYGPNPVTIPPDFTANINYADNPTGPIRPTLSASTITNILAAPNQPQELPRVHARASSRFAEVGIDGRFLLAQRRSY